MSQKSSVSGISKGRSRRTKNLPPRFRPDAYENVDDRFSTVTQDFAMGDLFEALPEQECLDEQPNKANVTEAAPTVEGVYQAPYYQVTHADAYLVQTTAGYQQVPMETYAVASMPPVTTEPVALVAPQFVRTQPEPEHVIPDQMAATQIHPDPYVADQGQQYGSLEAVQQAIQPPSHLYQSTLQMLEFGPYQSNASQVTEEGAPEIAPSMCPSVFQPPAYMTVTGSIPVAVPIASTEQVSQASAAVPAPNGFFPPPVPQNPASGAEAAVAPQGYWCYIQTAQQTTPSAPVEAAPHVPQFQIPTAPVTGCPFHQHMFPTPPPAEVQLPTPPQASSSNQSSKRDLFEAAKDLAKSLASQSSCPQATEAVTSTKSDEAQSPSSLPKFPILEYSQTTLLAFAYELNNYMDEDAPNFYQVAKYLRAEPAVVKNWFLNRRLTSALMKENVQNSR